VVGTPQAFQQFEVAINPPAGPRYWDMPKPKRLAPLQGQELISLAQKLARDAERHAILSASLASQADRLMHTGLRLLEPQSGSAKDAPLRS
jgi:hypothetical protein